MLYRDEFGLPVDQTGDGGDSANRAGLLALFGYKEKLWVFEDIRTRGLLCRHPGQEPWNNPWNFTRDQLMPFMAGCWRQRNTALARRVFWSHAKRFFFCQNIERDYPGTRKSLLPQYYRKGDRFDDRTIIEKDGWVFKPNFADILMPHDIWTMVLCARLRIFYIFFPIGYTFSALAIIFHCLFNKSNDEGQIIALAKVNGKFFVWLYKKLKPDWPWSLHMYWSVRRKMDKMEQIIQEGL